MRSIPFKVVALLGLNFDKFPRKESPVSFNLMEKDRRKGDRNVKENDKHLFLETLLSAQQYLYISFLGQNVKDNTDMPPSALVDELVDYIEAGYQGEDDVRKIVITKHPLHSFSRRYALGDKRLYNYIIDKAGDNTALFDFDKQHDPFKAEEISLGEFISFFKNPFKAYYNKVLGIWYDDESTLLGDTELFELDALQQWSLKRELLELKEEERKVFRDKLVKTGRLPLKNMAEVTMKNTMESVSPVRALLRQTVGAVSPGPVSIEIPVSDALLKGTIQSVYNNQLVFVCFSKGEWKYQVEAYILYLAGRAAGVLDGLHFISAHKEEVYTATPISQQDARQRLEQLLELYIKGHNEIVAFYPEFKVDHNKIDALDFGGFLKIVNDKLDNYKFPCKDQYIMLEYNKGYFNDQNACNDFKANCHLLLSPLTQLFPTYYQ